MTDTADWEAVGPEVLKVAQTAMEAGVRKAADDIYERMLYSVQEYFSENVTLNIASTIDMHKRNMVAAREAAEATEAENRRLLIEARPDAVAQVRRELEDILRQRADWLKSEYQKGGSYEHLKPREEECRAIVSLLERGRLL